MMRASTRGVDETRALGEALAGVLRVGDVVLLAGPLGSGKTALTQGIGRGLGVDEPVVSPSFVIMRSYAASLPLNHVDVYRLDHVQELYDLGFDEIFDGDAVTVVEWGDRVAPHLRGDRLEIRLDFGDDDDVRVVECHGTGPSWNERAEPLREAVARWTGG